MLTPAMVYTLWACVCTYWVTGARSLLLGVRKYPFFTAFVLVMNGLRGLWFGLDPDAGRRWWDVSSFVSNGLQLAVTIEAYLILARQVKNFDWRWNVLGVLALPGVFVAGVLSLDNGVAFRAAMYFTQVAGFGLGIVAFLGFGLSAAIPLGMSRNSLIHSAVVATMWLSSGVGFMLYHHHWLGWWILVCVPALACLAWALLMTPKGERRPPGPTEEEVREAEDWADRKARDWTI